jgi:hypothetical protein
MERQAVVKHEIEISPRMVEVGVETLWRYSEHASSAELVEMVYRAMARQALRDAPR